jgi:ribose 5-phosphate isomerase B
LVDLYKDYKQEVLEWVMQVYIGADHRGFKLKEIIKESLREYDYQVTDLGNDKYEENDDYPDISIKLAEKVTLEKAVGILICASGVGVCVAANKVKGVRAALCTNERQARLAKEDDDANVLCLATDIVDEETNINICKVFLEAVFSSEERHIRRINKIKTYESKIG